MKKERVYISGRMSGEEPSCYLARFARAAELLETAGYKAVNPTKFLPCRWLWVSRLMGYTLTLLYDLWRLSHCDRVYLIPGWMESRGACVESFYAYKMRIKRIPQDLKDEIDKRMEKFIIKQEKYEKEKV